MKISNHFNLNKTQAELDFVDVDTTRDLPLFLDPFFLSLRQDSWSIEATRTIRSFFQRVLELLNQNENEDARSLFTHLGEVNETCLGMSKGNPSGRGVGDGDSDDIFDSIVGSVAAQTGLIQDLQDNILFVNGFGKDKLSDMTTNIIRKSLIEYTQKQCELHNIPLTENVPSGFFWNRRSMQWEQEYTNMLIIQGQKILLVPKGVVSFCADYTPTRYYNHFVLNFMQNEHLRLNSALVQTRKNGNRYVTKKELRERHPFSKDFIADFTNRNPQVLQNFKNQTNTDSLTNQEISDVDINNLKNHLINELRRINTGSQEANTYHKLITGILELIFYPNLIYPTLELEIHEGRKRIDIVFDNAATTGIFFRFSNNMNLPCQYIMVECKNYSSDPVNPELDQLAGRFSPNRGKVGFLLCRNIDNFERFIQRCQDTYRDERGLIIPLVDEDLIQILENYNDRNNNYLEEFLSERVRMIAIN